LVVPDLQRILFGFVLLLGWVLLADGAKEDDIRAP